LSKKHPGEQVVSFRMAKVETAIKSPQYMSVLQVVTQTGFSQSTVHRIVQCALTRHLKFWKVSARFVPKTAKARTVGPTRDDVPQQLDTEVEAMLERVMTGDETSFITINQRQSKHEDSRMPTKFEVLSSVGKLTVQFLGNMMCILVVEFHEHDKSVNAFFTAAYSSVLHEESIKD